MPECVARYSCRTSYYLLLKWIAFTIERIIWWDCISASVHQHQAVIVVSLRLVSQCLDQETVIARRPEDVDAAGFHGRPDVAHMNTGSSRQFTAFFTPDAGTGQKDERLVVSVLEQSSFQIHKHVHIRSVSLAAVLRFWRLNMKKDRPCI